MPLTLTPQLTVSERYFENHYGNIPNIPVERDLVSSFSPSLKFDYQRPLLKFEGDYSLEAIYFRKNPDQNNFNQKGSVNLFKEAPRGSIQMKGSILSTNWPEAIFLGNNGILVRGARFLQEKGDLLWSYEAARRSSFSLNYDYTRNEYDTTPMNNSEIHSGVTSLTYEMDRRNRFIFAGEANLYQYPSTETRYKSLIAKADWNDQFDKLTLFQAGAGMGIATGYYRFFLWDATITRNIENGTFQVGFNRFFSAGGGIIASPVITQQATMNLSRVFREHITVNLSSSYGESYGYQPGIDFSLRFWNGALGLNYPVLSWLNASLSFSHYNQTIDGTGGGSSRSDQFLATLSSNFSSWRVF